MDLNTLNVNKDLKQKLITPMPDYLVKDKPGGGGKTLSYYTGTAVIDKLNATFGYAWSWEIISHWVQESIPYTYKENPSQWQGPVAHVLGKLTVPMTMDDGSIIEIVKTATGSQPVLGRQTDQEHIFKSASTDALKKAATLFGIAAELYRNDNETYFFQEINYEDPWTDEMLLKYAPQRESIKKFKEVYKITDEEMNSYIEKYSEGEMPTLDYLTPDAIEGFVDFLDGLRKEKKK